MFVLRRDCMLARASFSVENRDGFFEKASLDACLRIPTPRGA